MRYEALEWDSAFFALPIGRIVAEPREETGLGVAVAEADHDGMRCLYFLCDADDDAGLQSALDLGFRPYDVRIEFECPLQETPGGPDPTHEAQPADLPALDRIARERFRETRFSSDPRFPRERVGDLYSAWLQRGLSTPPQRRTLVAGEAEGLVVCHFDGELSVGTIELIGVAEGAEGRGLGRDLMAGAHRGFLAAGLDRAVVVTQGRNVGAQRLYQRCGYRTTRASIWLHRWRDQPAPPS